VDELFTALATFKEAMARFGFVPKVLALPVALAFNRNIERRLEKVMIGSQKRKCRGKKAVLFKNSLFHYHF
jgi:hypothetical protein